ncbi:MAG: hypothetical protein SGPRY_011998, partial [Prymnesium sp.]
MLAGVVGSFTGVKVKKGDAEYIENAQDTFLRHYCNALKKAKHALLNAKAKARKSGRELASHFQERVDTLNEQLYRCTFAGVPRNVTFCDSQHQQSEPEPNEPIHKQPVPFRTIEFTDLTNLRLNQELSHLLEREVDLHRKGQREIERIISVAEQHKPARRKAERAVVEGEEAQRALEVTSKSKVQQLTQAREARGGARGGTIEREDRAPGGSTWRDALGCSEVSTERGTCAPAGGEASSGGGRSTATCRGAGGGSGTFAEAFKARGGARGTERLRAQATRLECQIGAAHFDAARLARKEERARQQAETKAEEEAQARLSAEEQAAEAAQSLKRMKRQADCEAQKLRGRLVQLGSQVGQAHAEAARATERAREAAAKAEALQNRLVAQEAAFAEQLQHVRDLKAAMARRAR